MPVNFVKKIGVSKVVLFLVLFLEAAEAEKFEIFGTDSKILLCLICQFFHVCFHKNMQAEKQSKYLWNKDA